MSQQSRKPGNFAMKKMRPMMAKTMMMNRMIMSIFDFTNGLGGLLFLGGRTGFSWDQRG